MQKSRKKPKFVFISLLNPDNVGLRSIVNFLSKHGFSAEIVYFKHYEFSNLLEPTQDEIVQLKKKIDELKPDIVGISLTSSAVFGIAKRITKFFGKDYCIVWGGVHVVVDPDSCLDHADAVCVGEGEKPMLELAKKFHKKDAIKKIKGLWSKKNDKIYKNKLPELLQPEDMDFLPPEKITHYLFCKPGNVYRTVLTIGCPYNCTFCCTPYFRKVYGKGYVRERPIDDVISEIEKAIKKSPEKKYLQLIDDSIAVNKRRAIKFLKKYQKEIGLPFDCQCNPSFLDRELMEALKKAGNFRLQLGIQSGSERVRKEVYHRHDSNLEILRGLDLVKEYGISTLYQLILDNPFEKKQDFVESIKFLLEAPRPMIVVPHSLTYFPKTKITEMALSEKKITPDEVEGKNSKAMKEWMVKPNRKRKPENNYLYGLILLSGVFFFPRFLLKSLVNVDPPKKIKNLFFRLSYVFHKIDLFVMLKFYDFRKSLTRLIN